MIKGNTMDVFSIAFDNGDQFSLMARDKTTAFYMAKELLPESAIVKVERIDEWSDHD